MNQTLKRYGDPEADPSPVATSRKGSAPGKRTRTTGLAAQIARDSQGAARGGAGAALADAESSSGAPLPASSHHSLGAALGATLDDVRVHDGAASDIAARSLGARAFTVGSDIHFAAGRFAPGSPAGDRLLAHEVAHTQQQAGATSRPMAALEVSQPGDSSEVEAEGFADWYAAGVTSGAGPLETPPSLARRSGALLSREIEGGGVAADPEAKQAESSPGPLGIVTSFAELKQAGDVRVQPTRILIGFSSVIAAGHSRREIHRAAFLLMLERMTTGDGTALEEAAERLAGRLGSQGDLPEVIPGDYAHKLVIVACDYAATMVALREAGMTEKLNPAGSQVVSSLHQNEFYAALFKLLVKQHRDYALAQLPEQEESVGSKRLPARARIAAYLRSASREMFALFCGSSEQAAPLRAVYAQMQADPEVGSHPRRAAERAHELLAVSESVDRLAHLLMRIVPHMMDRCLALDRRKPRAFHWNNPSIERGRIHGEVHLLGAIADGA